MYSLKIKDKDGNYINEITNWNNFSYGFELNRPGDCYIDMNIDVSEKFIKENLATGKTYIDIYRYKNKVWSGILLRNYGNIDEDIGKVILKFKGYLWLLNKMFVSPEGDTFEGIDEGTILWTLIDDFQSLPNGDFGITEGSVATGVTRDRTYQALKNVYEAFIQMTEVENGCDVEITPEKVLNVYSQKGRRLNHVFEYGKNIKKFDFNFRADDLANCVYTLGSTQTNDLLYSVAHNAGKQEEYNLMQSALVYPDVSEVDTLTEHAKEKVESFKDELEIYSLSCKPTDPSFGSYSVGDEMRIIINKGFIDIDTYKRIEKINIYVNSEEKEEIRVDFQ